ncbi:hypothetical protein [Acetobacteroides hydrogenigenes]|uniref:hypothetical protein n=1 Tax=Acetobacteroides hydrogenigenes TaxID=979970 RepID=UPI001048C74A|nr:hypothetical protein [Acetobacteroides hydrogenigenes]
MPTKFISPSTKFTSTRILREGASTKIASATIKNASMPIQFVPPIDQIYIDEDSPRRGIDQNCIGNHQKCIDADPIYIPISLFKMR